MLGKQNKAGRPPRIYNIQNPTKKILIIIICSLLTRVHSFTFLKNQHLVYPDKEFNDDDDNNNDNNIHNVNPESRRVFVGMIAAGFGLSLIGPDIASAKELSSSISLNELSSVDSLPTVSQILPYDSSTVIMTTTIGATGAVKWNSIFLKAIGGGKAGASAAVVQVMSLMWLRTSMNRQYRYGGDLVSSLKELWNEGGIPRLYQGLPFAIVQGPLTRFGDTAANVGVLALLESIPETQSLPLFAKTAIGSVSAGLWRIFLMPIDISKTACQVEGEDGLTKLLNIVSKEGPSPLYNGALAQAAATAAGHFPWFLTYNYVDKMLPTVLASDDLLLSLARSALLGICASSVSDISSNSLRVIKVTKQTARLGSDEDENDESLTDDKTYSEIVQMIIEKDGIAGLFGRGLQTRLIVNCIQGAVFSILFKYFQQIQ
mmetsp:Transcript_51291/g.59299  ORF Transcript_51291/g.59299 Transcript_51291/m.59299 type:complete len:431 (+) Transcript_51291:85-1377(+)